VAPEPKQLATLGVNKHQQQETASLPDIALQTGKDLFK
jgi:hypothetical protein